MQRLVIAAVLLGLSRHGDAEYKKLAKQPVLASGDTIPSGERAGAGSKVVAGKGFRFQVPGDAIAVDVGGGKVGYQYASKGFDGASYPIVVWATKEAFKGDIEDLIKRESAAAKKAGALVPDDGLLAFESSGITIAGKYSIGGGRRAEIGSKKTAELRVVAVHNKAAYILHCETPNTKNAWLNVKADCLIRGVTLHVDPKTFSGR